MNDVTGDQGGDIHFLHGPVPKHDGTVGDAGVQGFRGAFGAELVAETEPYADNEDHADHDGVGGIAEEDGQGGGDDEQQQDRACELPSQDRPSVGFMGSDSVRAEVPQAQGCLALGQACTSGVQLLQDVLGGEARSIR